MLAYRGLGNFGLSAIAITLLGCEVCAVCENILCRLFNPSVP